MTYQKLLIVSSLLILLGACQEKEIICVDYTDYCDKQWEWINNCEEECCGFSEQMFKLGEATAKGSYQDFGNCALFARERVPEDNGWEHDKTEKGFIFAEVDSCYIKAEIFISNVILENEKTISLKYAPFGLSEDFPTASYYILDYDVTLDQYDLLQSPDVDNWIHIESINEDTTRVIGTFQLAFVRAYDFEIWDDPNRPDTLFFTDGKFDAGFACY